MCSADHVPKLQVFTDYYSDILSKHCPLSNYGNGASSTSSRSFVLIIDMVSVFKVAIYLKKRYKVEETTNVIYFKQRNIDCEVFNVDKSN